MANAFLFLRYIAYLLSLWLCLEVQCWMEQGTRVLLHPAQAETAPNRLRNRLKQRTRAYLATPGCWWRSSSVPAARTYNTAVKHFFCTLPGGLSLRPTYASILAPQPGMDGGWKGQRWAAGLLRAVPAAAHSCRLGARTRAPRSGQHWVAAGQRAEGQVPKRKTTVPSSSRTGITRGAIIAHAHLSFFCPGPSFPAPHSRLKRSQWPDGHARGTRWPSSSMAMRFRRLGLGPCGNPTVSGRQCMAGGGLRLWVLCGNAVTGHTKQLTVILMRFPRHRVSPSELMDKTHGIG
jgi:hypothetical protein